MGCNITNAQQFYSKYGKDVSSDAVLFKSKAIQVLSASINALDRLGVRFWLSSGTCLGEWRVKGQCNGDFHTRNVLRTMREKYQVVS